MVKVFFNNSCNICRAEINHYKKYSEGNVEWVDVTDNQGAQVDAAAAARSRNSPRG